MGFYLSLSIIAERYVISGGRSNSVAVIFGYIFIMAWYIECLVQVVMASNRFISDLEIMSIMFIDIEGVYSYSNLLLVSYDIFSTSTSTTCYICVFRTIRNSSKTVANTVSKSRSSQDVKYLLQFVFISLFYIFTWVFFEILPHIVPTDQPQWYIVVPILICFNSSSNSVIYLTCNRDVQKSLSIPWLRNKLTGVKPSNVIVVTPMNNN